MQMTGINTGIWKPTMLKIQELYDKFVSGTDSGCWTSVMNDSNALFHLGDVLSHLLDVGTLYNIRRFAIALK